MYELLKEMIKPELFVLVPVLYFFGAALKRSQLADKHIPWVLGIVAMAMGLIYVLATESLSTWQEILLAIFSGITQGVLCAGASVYVNQIVKQAGKEE
ncbi:MAG: hypothetical protein E7402_01695 [Ruminococcaceae bacterium]|nr:hypothetical protein [Oscillospiraceae bacterium]